MKEEKEINLLDVKDMSEQDYKESLTNKNEVHEKKWDGTLIQIDSDGKNHVELWGRGILKDKSQSNYTKQFPEIVNAFILSIGKYKAKFLGELVVIDSITGHEKFSLLQRRVKRLEGIHEYAEKYPARVILFDVLYFMKKDHIELPFKKRRRILENIRNNLSFDRRYIRVINQKKTKKGKIKLWIKVKKQKLEGVCIKNLKEKFGKGIKKYKRHITEDVYISRGFRGTGRLKRMHVFGALEMKQLKNGEVIDCGNVGSGFSDVIRKQIQSEYLENLLFHDELEYYPVKKELVVEVKFDSITNDGIFRHPRFLRIRFDKTNRMCIRKN